jgi:hypothetical protein
LDVSWSKDLSNLVFGDGLWQISKVQVSLVFRLDDFAIALALEDLNLDG